MENKNRVNDFSMLEGSEIVSKRGEYEKVFDLGNGRRQAIMFAAPVHYKDEDGNWQEIDNTMETATDSNGRSVIRNRCNDIRMEFDKHRSAARISHKGRSLSWRLLNSADVSPKVISGSDLRQKHFERTGMRTSLDTPLEKRMNRGHKMNVELDYVNARPGLSVRYSVNGVRMKEDLILENANAASEAAILLPDDYEYSVDENMCVLVCDKTSHEIIFRFDTPVTTDANRNETTAAVTLEPCDEGVVMRYTVDAQFLNNAAYPVTIDPVVITPTQRAVVEDTYIYEKYPTRNFSSVYLMRSGTLDGYYSIAMLRFRQLPKLSASDTVINAQLRVTADAHGNSSEYMGCFPIIHSWKDNEVTWNNVGASNLENNIYISKDLLAYVPGTSGTRYFDLTPVYRDWYKVDSAGKSLNYGVAIHCPEGINDSNDYVEWASAQYNADTAPCMVVDYVSHAGRQSVWTYESMSAFRAGTAYADIYNGNLVYEHSDGGTTGSRMPVGLTHVYNSCLSASNPVGCGMGWRTTMHQFVNKRKLGSTNYYVWTDGGATEHYFKISGSQPYKDSEGMSLKLNTSGSVLTITDKGHNRMEFSVPTDETQKPMTKVYDAVGNSATLTYEGDLLKKITDGVGREITFKYESNMLNELTIPGRPTLTFSYTGNNLTRISYSDVTSGSTTFEYEDGSNMLEIAKNYDGNQVCITYENANNCYTDLTNEYAHQMRRVVSMENKNGSVSGAMKLIEYLPMTTKITAVDDVSENSKTITYQFNKAGNVVCAFDELGYAVSNVFEDPDALPNQQKSASKMRKVVINKLTNIDFSSGWTTIKANSGDTAAQDTTTRCLNMPSVKITKAGSGNTYHRLNASISTAGYYTFSAYVKNNTALTSGGLSVRIRSGSTIYPSRVVTGVTTSFNTDSAADGWDRIYVSANLPVGTVTVELVSTASTGSAWFACPQLETGSIPNHVNLLLNGDFTRTRVEGSQTFAADWDKSTGISTNSDNGIITENIGLPSGLSGNAMRIHSYANTSASSHCQSIAVQGKKDDVFVIGGWVDATSVYSGDTNFKPCIISRFKDTSGNWTSWQYNEFDVQRVGWKFAQWAIIAPKDYTEFRIGIQYARNNGTAKFSNIFVHREEFGQSFEYDSNKNITTVANLSTQKAGMEYDDADNLKSYRHPGADTSVKYTMNYGSSADERKKHLLRTSTTPTGVRQSYTYDSYGNVTQAVNQASGSTNYIRSDTTYTNGNYVATRKDARGNTVEYTVNALDGTTTSIKDPAGNIVNYDYDDDKRLTDVQASDGTNLHKNQYEYEKDRIKSISHNTTTDALDVTYNFEYDTFGRRKKVSVGTQKLSENTYRGNRSSLLSKVAYGNSQDVFYSYDSFNRQTGVKYNGDSSDRYTYEYGADGNVSIVRDNALGRVFQTDRDLADRPMGSQLRKTDNTLIQRTELDYDVQNRLVGFGEETSTGTHKTTYTYDNDNRIKEIAFDGTSRKVIYTYDNLGRIQQRSVVNGSTFTTQYSYVNGGYGTGSTTQMVETITQGDLSLSYAYNSRGHISRETRNGKTVSYSYNALGQLYRVDDSHEGTVWCYYFDRGGNITRFNKFDITDDSYISSNIYNYRTSGWKDVLTSYNGTSLTHDAIGNLTNDGTWTYTWQAGRQLKQMSKSGTTIQYQYDHNGLRVGKVVTTGGVATTTEYTLHGNLVTGMKQGSNTLHFFYDAQSRPALVEFNGVIYTYAHNYQGDIIAILDSTGAIVVEYYYDAWGRQYSVTGSMKDTLGKLNPFRYRGYVYDEETSLYYLRSRYYNPLWGRFINADTVLGKVGALGSHNLFAYCGNNPSNYEDPDGNYAMALALIGGSLLSGLLGASCSYLVKKRLPRITLPKISITGTAAAIAAAFTEVPARTADELKTALLSASTSYAGARDPSYNTEDYYFAFMAEDPYSKYRFLMYINVPLTIDEAVTVLSSQAIISALMNSYGFNGSNYGIYTDMEGSAHNLAVLTGGSTDIENHFLTNPNPGDYYAHYHAFYKGGPHIWFGPPSCKFN